MKIVNPIAQIGEQAATDFLKIKGHKIIERNFRKGYGEIDIISIEDQTLIFTEVKTRTSQLFGTPLEAIAYWKMKSLIKTAQFYAMIHPKLPQSLRIDAISVMVSPDGEASVTDHQENISV